MFNSVNVGVQTTTVVAETDEQHLVTLSSESTLLIHPLLNVAAEGFSDNSTFDTVALGSMVIFLC